MARLKKIFIILLICVGILLSLPIIGILIIPRSCRIKPKQEYSKKPDLHYYDDWKKKEIIVTSPCNLDTIRLNPKKFIVFEFAAVYAKDDSNAFFEGCRIKGADAETFEAIDYARAKDKNIGYWRGKPVQSSCGNSFKEIIYNSAYSTDGFDVFWQEYPLHVANPKKFEFLNIKGYGPLQWATDGKYYYYGRYKIPTEDIENIVIYEGMGGLCKDKNWVYLRDHKLNFNHKGKKIIDTIDAATFEPMKDKFGCIVTDFGRIDCKDTISLDDYWK